MLTSNANRVGSIKGDDSDSALKAIEFLYFILFYLNNLNVDNIISYTKSYSM